MTRRGALNRRQGGFTLVEIMVALAILGLFVVLVLPNFPAATEGARLGASARELAAALREARSLAIRENREIRVAVGADGTSYDFDGAVRKLPTAAVDRIAFAGPGGKAGTAALTFFADGGSSGGRFALGRGGLSREIAVDQVTGRVSTRD